MLTQPKSLAAALFLILASVFAMKALFHPGFYTSHDGWHQVARLYHFDQAITDGQFPPRWSGQLLNGFGYPLFIFSYHLPWWIATPTVRVGVTIFDAIKITFILTYLISGVSIYFWLNDMWGIEAGLVGAFIYLFTPYRFANIFVRANIGEAVSFAFMPLVCWALFRLYKKPSFLWVSVGAIGLAGIILSHMMLIFLFSVPLVLLFLVYFVNTPDRKSYTLKIIMMGLLGLGIAAYYLLPAYAYRNLIVFKELYRHIYQNHFTPVSKLIYSAWGYGPLGTAGEMSRQVGIVIWIVACLSLGLISLEFVKKRSRSLIQLTLIAFGASFVWAVFMMTKASLPVWKLIESQVLVDFPWRFLAVTTFSGSVLAGGIIKLVQNKVIRWLLVIFLILSAVYTNRNHLRVNQYTDIPLSLYIESELTTNTDDEYLPKWVNREAAKKKMDLVQTDQAMVSDLKRSSSQISFAYVSQNPSQAYIHHMYFPGWVYYIDNKKLVPEKSDKGEMLINLEAGKHLVKLRYLSTPIMRVGEITTLICLVIMLRFLLFSKNKLPTQ